MSCASALRPRFVVLPNGILQSTWLSRSNTFPMALPSSQHLRQAVRSVSAQPAVFPTAGFQTVPAGQRPEEEGLPNYKAERYYPVRIGQVFQERYQIVGKLGFGGGSTVWLCHDLRYVPTMRKFRGVTDAYITPGEMPCCPSRSAPLVRLETETPDKK